MKAGNGLGQVEMTTVAVAAVVRQSDERVETGVLDRRMKNVSSRRLRNLCWGLDLDQHLVARSPHALHLPERRPELVAAPFELAAVVRMVQALAQPGADPLEIGSAGIGAHYARQVALGMKLPPAFTPPRAVDCEALVFRLEDRLQGQALVADEQCLDDFEVFDRVGFVGKHEAPNREAHFGIAGSREHHAVPNAVILEIWQPVQIECELPGRRHRLDPLPEQRMCDRLDPDPRRFRRLYPECLSRPWIPRQAHERCASTVDRHPIDRYAGYVDAGEIARQLL